MRLLPTTIADVKLIEPRVFTDARGSFFESWNQDAFARVGIDARFVQDNESCSAKGVLRGLHYQVRQTQGKLVRVTTGALYDVAVDLRRSSPTFRRWMGVELSATNHLMLWIPPGFAHGVLALEDDTRFLYKCTDFYAPTHERALRWDDPELAIDWPLHLVGQPSLSPRDMAATPLAQAETFP